MLSMEKIVIIGSAGAGKTTLARELGDILKINVIHLDRYFWRSDWHEIPRDERVKIQFDLIKRPRWIIEGSYLSSSDDRLQAADTIIFLDMPQWLCFSHVIKRRFEFRNKQRDDLPEGCREKLNICYLLKVMVFPLRGRILFRQKIARLQRDKKINYYRFTSRREIAAFLHNISAEAQTHPAHEEERQLVTV